MPVAEHPHEPNETKRTNEQTNLFPEKTLPRWEVSTLEKGVFENTLDTPERLDHVRAVVVEVPKFTIMALMLRSEEFEGQSTVESEVNQYLQSTRRGCS